MVARVFDHAIRMRIEMFELGKGCAPQVSVWVSRITHQKMVDTVLEVLPALLDRDIQRR